jgi:hypothetical protein
MPTPTIRSSLKTAATTSKKPMRPHFRFASEQQSDSSHVLAERSPECKHERCRFGNNAVVVIPASGSDGGCFSNACRSSRDRSLVGRPLVSLPS